MMRALIWSDLIVPFPFPESAFRCPSLLIDIPVAIRHSLDNVFPAVSLGSKSPFALLRISWSHFFWGILICKTLAHTCYQFHGAFPVSRLLDSPWDLTILRMSMARKLNDDEMYRIMCTGPVITHDVQTTGGPSNTGICSLNISFITMAWCSG